MPRSQKKRGSFEEKRLKKGELRKLNALRKSLGDDIANRAFAQWLLEKEGGNGSTIDKNASVLRDAIESIVLKGRARIPRGGYLVRRGRGRVIVEQPQA